MRLYHLKLPDGTFVGVEFRANSDQEAREIAADRNSRTLRTHPNAVVARWGGEAWLPIADTTPIAPRQLHTPPSAPKPAPAEPDTFEKVNIYAVDPNRLRFGELSECLNQVSRALRQLERAQAAHRHEQARRLELGFTQGRVPDELVGLAVERADAIEFAIVAARRAVGARRYLTRQRGLAMPELRQSEKIWALRDLYEHWDEWKVAERDSAADDNRWLLTKSAGKRWERHSEGHKPYGDFGATAAPPPGPPADPDGRITDWNGVNIDELTEDLRALRDAIATQEAAAFEWEMPDRAAAIELVGPTVFTLIHAFTNLRGRPARDGVERWERGQLLAADHAIREQRWVINGDVLGPSNAPT